VPGSSLSFSTLSTFSALLPHQKANALDPDGLQSEAEAVLKPRGAFVDNPAPLAPSPTCACDLPLYNPYFVEIDALALLSTFPRSSVRPLSNVPEPDRSKRARSPAFSFSSSFLQTVTACSQQYDDMFSEDWVSKKHGRDDDDLPTSGFSEHRTVRLLVTKAAFIQY
jgi:hypothetical protein